MNRLFYGVKPGCPLLWQHFGIFSHGNCCINHNNKLRNRHGKPYRVCARQYRKKEYQYATDDHSPCHRHNKRCPRLHDSLKIIGGKNIKRQKQKGHRIRPDNVRSYLQYFRCRIHKVEKPMTNISRNLCSHFSHFTKRSVFLRLKKCNSITTKDMPEPITATVKYWFSFLSSFFAHTEFVSSARRHKSRV